jgi:hypothetical protein
MRLIFQWINKRFGTFDLLPQYFTAAGQQIQNVLWGALLPFLVWGIWFIVGTPPAWINWTAVFIALFIAGYYVWRADHARLQRKIVVTRVIPQRWEWEQNNIIGLATAYYFEVVNTSEAVSIRGVSVKLAEIRPAVANFESLPVPLLQKHDNPLPGIPHAQTFHLNPGEPKHIDLISASQGDEHISIRHIVPMVNTLIPAGRYELKVLITAEDMPVLFQWFNVWMDNLGVLQCEMK